ncbi:DUF448 domain-containing protein [Nitratifractor sp.]
MKTYPIRMCIACRNRESQHSLFRIQFEDNRVVPYRGYGRSAYICRGCAADRKRLQKIVKRYRLDESQLVEVLKELNTDG